MVQQHTEQQARSMDGDNSDVTLTRFVHLSTSFEALHRWPTAPPPDEYLQFKHRHLFVVETEIAVAHNDREIEINAAARLLSAALPVQLRELAMAHDDSATLIQRGNGPWLPSDVCDIGSASCEDIAEVAIGILRGKYGSERSMRCTVLEDGILGAGVLLAVGPQLAF